MTEETGVKLTVARAANALLDRAGVGSASKNGTSSHVWASLARYDDDFVQTLERWERHTRDEGGAMGVRRKGSGEMENEALEELFKDGRWDGKKMVRSFARMGTLKDEDRQKETTEEVSVWRAFVRVVSD